MERPNGSMARMFRPRSFRSWAFMRASDGRSCPRKRNRGRTTWRFSVTTCGSARLAATRAWSARPSASTARRRWWRGSCLRALTFPTRRRCGRRWLSAHRTSPRTTAATTATRFWPVSSPNCRFPRPEPIWKPSRATSSGKARTIHIAASTSPSSSALSSKKRWAMRGRRSGY